MPNDTKHKVKKLPPEQVAALEQQSVVQQFNNDASVLQTYLSGPPSQGRDALKRVLLLAQHSDIEFRNEEDKEFQSLAAANAALSEKDPQFALASLLMHGGRLTGEIPPIKTGERPNEFLLWLFAGKIGSNQKSAEEKKTAFHRLAATHWVDEHGDEVLMGSSPTQRLRQSSTFAKTVISGRHYGINFGFNGPEDGHHGHMYLYFDPPTTTKPGRYLIGIENSAPGKDDIYGNTHDSKATSPIIGPGGSLKYRHESFANYPIRPAREKGLRTKHLQSDLQNLYKLTPDSFEMESLSAPITAAKKAPPRETLETPTVQTELQSLKSQIGKYGTAEDAVSKLTKTQPADNPLYKAHQKYSKKYASKVRRFLKKYNIPETQEITQSIHNQTFYREKFIAKLAEIKVKNYDGDPKLLETDPKKAAITMNDLLGKDGTTFYHLALEEEVNSKEYIDAVIDQSTRTYEGQNWAKRPMVLVGGPSASGKTTAANNAILAASEFLDKAEEGKGSNKVIFVDGGIAREVSQMRKLALKFATNKGYPGIRDLQSQSKKYLEKIKHRVYDFALNHTAFGMVIPETFAKLGLPIDKSKKYIDDATTREDVTPIFTRVEGKDPSIFRKVVSFLGSSRAWKRNNFDNKDDLALNAKPSCESKSYDSGGFKRGVEKSKEAEKTFKNANPNALCMVITNDLVLKKKDKNGEIIDAKENEAGAFAISERVLQAWLNLSEPRPDLDEYKKTHATSLISSAAEISLKIIADKLKDEIEAKSYKGDPHLETLKAAWLNIILILENSRDIQKIKETQTLIANIKDQHSLLEKLDNTLNARLVELKKFDPKHDDAPKSKRRATHLVSPFFAKHRKKSDTESTPKNDSSFAKMDVVNAEESVSILKPATTSLAKAAPVQSIDFTQEEKITAIKTSLPEWEVTQRSDTRSGNFYEVTKEEAKFTVHQHSFKTTNTKVDTFIAMLKAFRVSEGEENAQLPSVIITDKKLFAAWSQALDKVYPELSGRHDEIIKHHQVKVVLPATPEPAHSPSKTYS